MTERKEEMAAEILRKQEEREWAVFVGKGRGKWPVGEATGLASRLCLSHGSVNLCDPSCEFWHISHFSKPPFTLQVCSLTHTLELRLSHTDVDFNCLCKL